MGQNRGESVSCCSEFKADYIVFCTCVWSEDNKHLVRTLKQLVVDSVFVRLIVMKGFRHTVIQIMHSQSLQNSDLQCVT